MGQILIVGKAPPPIGGITIHVSRLVQRLRQRNFTNFLFCDTGVNNLLTIFKMIRKANVLHLHISNPYLQLLVALFCRIHSKNLIITYHGNWGRYHYLGNAAVNVSAFLCSVPVVQNRLSLAKAKWWNPKALCISTYLTVPIPELTDSALPENLKDFIRSFKLIFCTNAWNVTWDKNGRETYGIISIINKISLLSDTALLVSDPSGNYEQYVRKTLRKPPTNVYFITVAHDFRHVLKLSDVFIRNTTTDGVSLSIHEAAELNVPILASDAVERPPFCQVFQDLGNLNLKREVRLARKRLEDYHPKQCEEPFEQLIELYQSFRKYDL